MCAYYASTIYHCVNISKIMLHSYKIIVKLSKIILADIKHSINFKKLKKKQTFVAEKLIDYLYTTGIEILPLNHYH